MAGWQDAPVVTQQAQPSAGPSWQSAPVAAPQQSPAELGEAAGQKDNALVAAGGQFLQQALPGNTASDLEAAGGAAADFMAGRPVNYQRNLEYAKGRSQGQDEGSKIASTIGGVAGGIAGLGMGGSAVNDAAKVIPGAEKVLAKVAPVAGQPISNVLKSAVMNGAATFGLQKAKGTDTGLAAEEAGGAALAGPVLSKAAAVGATKLADLVPSFSLSKLPAASAQAYRELANAISEDPKTLEAAVDSHLKATGNLPATAQIMNYKSQGQLAQLAAANPVLGDAAMKAAQAGGMPLHDQLNGITGPVDNLDTQTGLEQARKDRMDAAMSRQSSTGVALRDEPLPDPQGVLRDPHVGVALRPNVAYNARVNQPSPIMGRIATGQQTVGDAEEARYQTRQAATNHMTAGETEPYKNYSSVSSKVENLAASAYPEYSDAMAQYRTDSRYANAFQHGVTGNAQNAVPPGATSLARDLDTPEGKAGFQHGQAIYKAAKSVQGIAPNSIAPQEELPASHVAQGAMAAVTHGAASAFHMIRALPNARMSDEAAKVVADKLYDPAQTATVINNLRRFGASNQDIRQLGATVGGAAGQKILNSINPGTGQ